MRTSLFASLLLIAASCTSDSEHLGLNAETADASSNNSAPLTVSQPTTMNAESGSLYALQTSSLEGESMDLSQFAGKVTLVVNVASECGYTPQYAGLQKLQEELGSQGFNVLGVPSNEFGGQEPGTAADIRKFCTSRFNVTFPMLEKCKVKSGPDQSPLFAFLQTQTGETPNWNFCKYLVGKNGEVVAFYKSSVKPDDAELRKAILTALG